MITQAEIKKLQDMRKRISILQADEKRLRSTVLRKHNNFEDIEGGRLMVKVSSRQAMAFTKKALLTALGRERFRKLKAQVEPTKYQVVDIVGTSNKCNAGYGPASSYDFDCDEDWE